MLNARANSRLSIAGLLLVMAGCLVLPFELNGQTALAPAQSPAPAKSGPAAVQARLDMLADALKAARAVGDAMTEAKTLNQIGRLHYQISDFQKALDDYNQALALARSAKDAVEEAEALNGVGSCYRAQGQSQRALETAQQALDVATAAGDERGQAEALNGLGWASSNLGTAPGAKVGG